MITRYGSQRAGIEVSLYTFRERDGKFFLLSGVVFVCGPGGGEIQPMSMLSITCFQGERHTAQRLPPYALP